MQCIGPVGKYVLDPSQDFSWWVNGLRYLQYHCAQELYGIWAAIWQMPGALPDRTSTGHIWPGTVTLWDGPFIFHHQSKYCMETFSQRVTVQDIEIVFCHRYFSSGCYETMGVDHWGIKSSSSRRSYWTELQSEWTWNVTEKEKWPWYLWITVCEWIGIPPFSVKRSCFNHICGLGAVNNGHDNPSILRAAQQN